LEVNVLLVEVLLGGSSAFVVEALEVWVEASSEEGGMELLVSSQDGGASAIFDGFGKDGIAVVVVDEQQVVVAMTRWGNKVARLVSVDLASWFEDGSKAVVVGLVIGGRADGREVIIKRDGWGGIRHRR
jgi:hypothetical protein